MQTAGALKYLSVILSGLFLLLFLLVFNLDFGRFKPQAEAWLSSFLGRQFTTAGPLHITLDLNGRLIVSASELSLAGTDWSSESELAQLAELELRVDLWSALGNGPVLIDALIANGLQVYLEKDTEGRNNWSLLASDDEEGDDERFTLPVFPSHLQLEDVQVTYRSPGLSEPLNIKLGELTETIHTDRELALTGKGSINGQPLNFALTSPQAGNLVDLRDVKARLKGHLGDISVAAEVDVDDLLHPARPTADIDLSGPSVEYLLNLLNIDPLTSGPLHLTGSVTPDGQDMGLQLQGAFGEFTLAVNGRFSDLRTREKFRVKSSIKGPNLGRLANFLGVDHVLPSDPFSFHSLVTRSGKDISVEEWTLEVDQATLSAQAQFDDFPDPNGARGKLRLDIPALERFSGLLQLPGEVEGAAHAALAIKPIPGGGGATFEGSASHAGMVLELAGEVEESHDFVGSRLRVNLRGATTAVLAKALGIGDLPAQAFSAQLHAGRTTTGFTVQKSWAVVGDNRLDLDGTIGNKPLQSHTALEIELAGPSMEPILRPLLGPARHFPQDPYRVKGQVKALDGRLLLNDVVATLGRERVTVTGAIAREPLSPGTELQIEASSPELRGALVGLGLAVARLPEGKLTANVVLRGGEGLLHLDGSSVEYAGVTAKIDGVIRRGVMIDGSDLVLDLSGSDLSRLIPSQQAMPGLARPFTLAARLRVEDNFLQIDDADLRIDKTRLQAQGQLALAPFLASASFSLVGDSPNVLPLVPRYRPEFDADRLPFRLRGRGIWDKSSLTLNGFELKIARAEIRADGTLDNPPNFDQTNLALSVNIPDLSRLRQLAGRELPVLPLKLDFSLSGSGNNVQMKNLNASLGESDLAGELSLRYGDKPELQGTFRSAFFDVTPLLPPPPDPQSSTKPKQSPAGPFGKSRKETRVIPAAPIPMKLFRTFDAELKLEIQQARMDAHSIKNLRMVSSVANGTLTIQRLELDAERGGRLRAGASLRPSARGGELGIRLSGDTLSFGLPATSEEEIIHLPQYDLDFALLAQGATVREMAAGANGYLKMNAGKGRYKTGRMRLLTNDFIEQLVATLNPFAKQDPYMNVRCAAVLAAVEGGKVVGKPVFVLSSDRLNIFANADVDLATEKLSLTFNTVPQKGLGISLSNLVNPYIMVAGTLANPVLSLDPESALIQGGAAVATAGLSILAKSFKDRYLSSRNPCRSANKEASALFRALEEKYSKSVVLLP